MVIIVVPKVLTIRRVQHFPAHNELGTCRIKCFPSDQSLKEITSLRCAVQERKVAVESLMAIANQLHSAHHALADKLMGRQDLPEQYALDLFYQSVKSSSDVQDFILRTAARLNLPIKWLPDRIAEQNFNLEEPPTKASAWVAVLLNQHLKVFRERLSTMPMLSTADVDQVGSLLNTFCCG